MNNNRLDIFISTPYSYRDVLNIFVKCFEKNCGNCKYPLVFATNYDLKCERGIVINSQNLEDTWVERALIALKEITSKYVLLMGDDMFIMKDFDYEKIDEILDFMDKKNIMFCSFLKFYKRKSIEELENVYLVHKRQAYGKNLFCGIFKTEYLISILESEKKCTGWDIERKWFLEAVNAPNEWFDNVIFANDEIVSFTHAVVKGKFLPNIKEKLQKQGISIDSNRETIGFFEDLRIKIIRTIGILINPRIRQKIKPI
jgi:hypothetical protein